MKIIVQKADAISWEPAKLPDPRTKQGLSNRVFCFFLFRAHG